MGKIKIGFTLPNFLKKNLGGLIILGSIALVGLVVGGTGMAKNGSDKGSPAQILLARPNFEETCGGQGKTWEGKTEFVTDEIVVKFKGDVKPFRVIKIPEGKVGEKVKEYSKRADVIYAEPNYIAYALMVPNDPYYSYQWHLDNLVYGGIGMEAAWDISTGDPSVVVAIVDTGIAYEDYRRYCQAPDLAQTFFVPGYDFVNHDSHPNDDNRHGTHVAGTVAQSTNNSLGVAGVAFNTSLMPVKVLDSRGSGTYAAVASGIRYAADNGAKVINLSLGGSSGSETLRDAVAYAYNNGVTVVAACGNDNASVCLYPAAYDDYVIAVGATQYDETKAPYSNYGPSLDLVAPGGNNNLDQNNDGYADGVLQQTFSNSIFVCDFAYYFFQGTSMATPHVSGVAALLLAKGNATTPDEVRAALQETAEDLGETGRDDTYGWGLVDAYAALQWTAAPCTTDADCPADGWFDTGNTRWVEDTECTEKEQKEQEYRDYYCDPALDCQYTVTATQWIDTGATRNKADNTSCTNGVCCSGVCEVGLTKCPVMCWSANYQYLHRNKDQAKKFCKCAQGTYGYKSYDYKKEGVTVYQYVDTGDNENWEVTSKSSYLPIYQVKCIDGLNYPTKQDYFYPK